MRQIFLALAFSALASLATAAAAPFYAEYKSWLVACDNTGSCTARAFALDGGPATDITVTRAAGPDGAVRAVSPLVLPLAFQGNPAPDDPTDMLTEPDFEPATGTLSTFAKGRGLGDCGLTARWIWDGDTFKLSALRPQWPVDFCSSSPSFAIAPSDR